MDYERGQGAVLGSVAKEAPRPLSVLRALSMQEAATAELHRNIDILKDKLEPYLSGQTLEKGDKQDKPASMNPVEQRVNENTEQVIRANIRLLQLFEAIR